LLYAGKPTFIIDTNRKDMTVVWSELPDDVKLRQQAKELGLPQMPPPPAANATIVLFLDEQISAVLVEPWSIMTFSFFPKLGTVFIGQQYILAGLNRTTQMSVFGHCEFSWTNPRRLAALGFVTGLRALGLLGWCRKRKAAAALAA
jgi:hypothetical protein